jgi:hypothetical protein
MNETRKQKGSPDEVIDSKQTSRKSSRKRENKETRKSMGETAETIIDSKVRDERDRKTGRKPVGNDGQQAKHDRKQRS